jgi:hypothetical protein
MMAMEPQSVAMSEVDVDGDRKPVGCFPSPKGANVEFGQEWVEKLTDCLVSKGNELLARAG